MLIIWGTRSLGQENLRVHRGTCQFCGRTVDLRDYDTSQWFMLYYIPIIPLGRKSVINHCPTCDHCLMGPVGTLRPTEAPEAAEPEDEQAKTLNAAEEAILDGDLARAEQLLRLHEADPKTQHARLLLTLADAYQAQDDHAEALEVFRVVLAGHPELAAYGNFCKAVHVSERHCPEAKRVLPVIAWWRRTKFQVYAVLVVVALVFIGINYWLAAHRVVHVVNGLADPIEVAFDGRDAVRIRPKSVRMVILSEGRHEGSYTRGGRHREEAAFTVPGPSWFLPRFFGQPTHVLSPFGAAAVIWEKTTYVPDRYRGPRRNRERVFHVGKDLVSFDELDYVFAEFPKSVKVRDLRAEQRTRIGTVKADAADVVAFLHQSEQAPAGELMRFAEAHLRARPADRPLLWLYTELAREHARHPRALAFLDEGLRLRPTRVDWHRANQNLREALGQGDDLLAQYRKLLADHPSDPDFLYLFGRLQIRCSDVLTYAEKARREDPNHPYAHLAIAYHALALGRFDEAAKAAETLEKLVPDDPTMTHMTHDAFLAAGRLEELEWRYRKSLKESPQDLQALTALLNVLQVGRDPSAADAVVRRYEEAWKLDVSEDPFQWLVQIQTYQGYVQGRLSAALAAAKTLKDPELRNLQCMELYAATGEVDRAAQCIEDLPERSWQEYLALSVAAYAAGQADLVRKWRARAVELLAKGDREDRNVGELLAAGAKADVAAARDASAHPQPKSALLVALVQAGADKSLLDLAERLNYSPAPPHRVIQSAIQKLRKPR